jgi:hypothetical protein
VIWVIRPLEILQVARNAGGAGQVKVAPGVALFALQLRMSTREGESDRIVIEAGRLPGSG